MEKLPDPHASEGLITSLDAISRTAENISDISRGLFELADTGDNQAGWLATAFDYSMRMRPWDLDEDGGVFGPRQTGAFGTYPTPLNVLSNEVVELWANVVARCDGAAPTARLNHILFEKRHGHGGERIRATAEAYRKLAVGQWNRLDRVKFSAWSYELFRRLNEVGDMESVLVILGEQATESMRQESREPGVALLAIEAIVRADPVYRKLDELLTDARNTYSGDCFIEGHVLDLRLRASVDDETTKTALRRAKVEILLDHAVTLQPGIVQMGFLEDAAQLAQRLGFPDLRSRAIVGLQRISEDDLGLVPIGTTIEIPVFVMDRSVEVLLEGGSMRDLIRSIVNGVPPSGDVTSNRIQAEALALETPFASLTPTQLLGPDAMPQFTAASDDERDDERLSQVEVIRLGIEGEVLARALEEGQGRFAPNDDELTELFWRDPRVSEATARSIARALLAFGDKRYEESAAVAMTRVETLVRELCREVGRLTFQIQVGRTRGGYPQLGGLLANLDGVIDASWHRFLRTFLVSPYGPNFRNEMFHGYLETVRRNDAALVLVAAFYLAFVEVGPIEVVT